MIIKPRYGLSITVQPAVEPVEVADFKNFVKLDSDVTTDDALLASILTAARRKVEAYAGVQLITATYFWTLDSFFGYEMPGGQFLLGKRPLPQQIGGGGVWPYLNILRFPRSPIQSVSSIVYTDTTGTTQTYDPTQYSVDVNSLPGRITPIFGTVWPVTQEIPNAVRITFVAGFGGTPDTVPEEYKQAIRAVATWMYYNRGDVNLTDPPNVLLSDCDNGTYY